MVFIASCTTDPRFPNNKVTSLTPVAKISGTYRYSTRTKSYRDICSAEIKSGKTLSGKIKESYIYSILSFERSNKDSVVKALLSFQLNPSPNSAIPKLTIFEAKFTKMNCSYKDEMCGNVGTDCDVKLTENKLYFEDVPIRNNIYEVDIAKLVRKSDKIQLAVLIPYNQNVELQRINLKLIQ